MPSVLGFGRIDEIALLHNAKLELEKRACCLPTPKSSKWAQNDDPMSFSANQESTGWKSLKDIYRFLDMFDQSEDYKRNQMQRRAHDFYIQSTLRAIFGSDFGHNIAKLREMFRLVELKQEVLVSAPRRNGKTYATCMYSSAVMCAVPNMTLACFSTGRRASRAFLLTTYKMLLFLGFKDWIVEFNQEVIMMRNPKNDKDERKISSFPSRPEIGRVFDTQCDTGGAHAPGRNSRIAFPLSVHHTNSFSTVLSRCLFV
jgi:hypothetical protein